MRYGFNVSDRHSPWQSEISILKSGIIFWHGACIKVIRIMDIQRSQSVIKRRRIMRTLYGSAGLILIALISVGLSRLKPAAPRVDGATIYRDTVKRGPMLREVAGNGTLVPEQIQLVQTETDGRVEKILVLPGALVSAETILVELSNPELKQSAFEAEWQLKAAEAQLARLKVQLASDKLAQEAAAATLKTESALADVDAETDEELAKSGLVPKLTLKKSKARAEELRSRYKIEQERIKIMADSAKAQIAVQEAEIAKLRAMVDLKKRQVDALRVRAGIEGVLQSIGDKDMLQVGQRVTPSATLAKVVQPTKLKAEIKVPETQAKDILIGQAAKVDTRNGVVPACVTRIDPAAQNGTVTVDLALQGPLPKGARPDMNVEGKIELENLTDVLNVGRPIQGQPESTASLFKMTADGKHAVRVQVKLGRSSVNTIEILSGLKVGDVVILSDMSQYDSHDRIRIN